MEHFRVLPTDERFLRLSDEQISVLILHWIQSTPDDYLKRVFWENRMANALPSEDDLSELGYSEQEIAAIEMELKNGRGAK